MKKSRTCTLLSRVASSVNAVTYESGRVDGVAACSSPVVAGEHTARTQPAYWHGGAPGLKVGEFILPPSSTGTTITLAAYMDEGEKARAGYRSDRVYVATQQEVAELYAALYPNGGWVYRVEPWMPLEMDPDCTEPGVSFACIGARIVKAVPLDALTAFLILKTVAEASTSSVPAALRSPAKTNRG
ncbi:hypothetical protein JQX13_50490 [Archangium violaceum]|uniref:hypothetical protein n=1 Tax=Archangium violaceum TaxID=83451 RepID=UPI00193C182A|nr:hypothetical protein [Archangium violaceum]QRK08095.1 hypothetical protein JQX13_50490 [Archangium violaceum]